MPICFLSRITLHEWKIPSRNSHYLPSGDYAARHRHPARQPSARRAVFGKALLTKTDIGRFDNRSVYNIVPNDVVESHVVMLHVATDVVKK